MIEAEDFWGRGTWREAEARERGQTMHFLPVVKPRSASPQPQAARPAKQTPRYRHVAQLARAMLDQQIVGGRELAALRKELNCLWLAMLTQDLYLEARRPGPGMREIRISLLVKIGWCYWPEQSFYW